MHPMIKTLLTGLALFALVGCGASPAAGPALKKAPKALSKPAATQPVAAQKVSSSPSVSTRTTPKAQAPAPKAPAQPAAPAAQDGTLDFTVAVTGNAPVAALGVKVYEQADPSLSQEFPLTVTNGAAAWSADEVPPGRYTFQVKALAADGTVLGTGNTEGIVKAGQATEVSLQMRVNTVSSADTTPADGGPATLDLNIEIL